MGIQTLELRLVATGIINKKNFRTNTSSCSNWNNTCNHHNRMCSSSKTVNRSNCHDNKPEQSCVIVQVLGPVDGRYDNSRLRVSQHAALRGTLGRQNARSYKEALKKETRVCLGLCRG